MKYNRQKKKSLDLLSLVGYGSDQVEYSSDQVKYNSDQVEHGSDLVQHCSDYVEYRSDYVEYGSDAHRMIKYWSSKVSFSVSHYTTVEYYQVNIAHFRL